MNRNDGGPAFPKPHDFNDGLTIRDYFAVHADMDDASYPATMGDFEELVGYKFPQGGTVAERMRWQFEAEALLRYMKADAMLARRDA